MPPLDNVATVFREAITLTRRGVATRDGTLTGALAASGGGQNYLEDDQGLPPAGAARTLFDRHWLWRYTADAVDEFRLVKHATYDGRTFRVTVGDPNYSTAPTTDGYFLTEDDPIDWWAALQHALREYVFVLHFDEWNPTDNDKRQYDVTAAPISETDIVTRDQILDVEVRDDSEASGERQWEHFNNGRRHWTVYNDAEQSGKVILDFDRGTPPQTDETVRMVVRKPHDVVSESVGSTFTVPAAWVRDATILAMAQMKGKPGDPDDDWRRIIRRLDIHRKLRAWELRMYGRYAGVHTQRARPHGLGPRTPARAGR